MQTKKWLIRLRIVLVLFLALSLSGCAENESELKNNSETLEDANTEFLELEDSNYASSKEIIIVPENIQVKEWKIVVDRILITIENTGNSDVFVNKIRADISFDEDMSTFKHYEAVMNAELGPQEYKVISIRIHQFSEWEKPYLKTIEVI